MTELGDGRTKGQSPLAGVVLCCTSIAPEQRGVLATMAGQMGAEHKFDLTSDVTHLVIGSVDTPKYKYVAKERPDVTVVVPGFVEAVRDEWVKGQDVDVAALEKKYKAPTFLGLRICVTGFEDVGKRDEMQDIITSLGAEFHRDLTKRVTHLVAACPKGKKYEYGCQWNIAVISVEWLWDSVERGMVLDETLYNPLTPEEERGKGAWNRAAPAPVTLGKRARQDEGHAELQEGQRRKLRRTASAKLGGQHSNIWADITTGGGTSPGPEPAQDSEHDGTRRVSKSSPGLRRGSLGPTSSREQLSRSLALGIQKQEDDLPAQAQGLFQGRIVFTHGFSGQKSKILHEHLAANGARLVTAPEGLEDHPTETISQGFLVLPHDAEASSLPSLPFISEKLTKTTELWLE
ncbi:hypothetical protein LTS18_005554, partial [Coniosporium uncinatum]